MVSRDRNEYKRLRARIIATPTRTVPVIRTRGEKKKKNDRGTFYFSALSSTERELFRELIRQLDRKINPGLGRLTWNTEYVDAYIEDCFNQTANVRFSLSLLSPFLFLSARPLALLHTIPLLPSRSAYICSEIYAASPVLSWRN